MLSEYANEISAKIKRRVIIPKVNDMSESFINANRLQIPRKTSRGGIKTILGQDESMRPSLEEVVAQEVVERLYDERIPKERMQQIAQDVLVILELFSNSKEELDIGELCGRPNIEEEINEIRNRKQVLRSIIDKSEDPQVIIRQQDSLERLNDAFGRVYQQVSDEVARMQRDRQAIPEGWKFRKPDGGAIISTTNL